MKIKFTKFEKGENWVSAVINDGEYTISSKLFDEGSVFGIDEGRVSKLMIRDASINDFWNSCIVNYDRGWDIKPSTDEHNAIFEAVMDFLENAPKTRFE